MSYIVLPQGIPSFSKAIISFWVRVPKGSMDKAIANTDISDPLAGMLPFVIWGPKLESTYDNVSMNLPSLIGLSQLDVPMSTPMTFAMHLGWDRKGSGWFCDQHDPNWEDVGIGIQFLNNGSFFSPGPIAFAPDVWHHILISWDFSVALNSEAQPWDALSGNPQPPPFKGVTSYGYVYLAMDDKNIKWAGGDPDTAKNPFWPCGGFGGGNGFTTGNGYLTAETYYNPEDGDKITYSFNPAPLPGYGEFGIPGVTRLIDDIYQVEMAEFQMWLGMTIDTADEQTRRAFVDENGKPVDPTKAAKMTITAQVRDQDSVPRPTDRPLGKPQIQLHKTKKWQAGKNTGTLDTLQFAPQGNIAAYKPDPQLGI